MTLNEHTYTLTNGITGVLASFGAVITTFQTQLEWWVRMSGSVLGILVAAITLYNLVRKAK
jgi:hypothetical protein